MKNKSRWDSLSMRDRATLINMYAKGGYTNIDDIRNHYNSFEEGGPEEENTVPTKEEYITKKLEEARLKALEKSRTRTIPKSPIILNEESEEDYNAKRELFTENISRLQETLKELETQKALGMFVDKQIENTRKNIKTYQDWLAKPYEKYKKGASCLYTATDNYGKEYLVSGNKSFASNPQKYGFKKIEKTGIQPGDLVQDVSLGYPNHAMIYNGKNESGLDTFNYSRGGDSEGDIVKGGIYKQNVPLDVFRFVGTAKDSTQYINDYNKLYGNKFGEGGPEDEYTVPTREEYERQQKEQDKPWYLKLAEAGQAARDARIGAVGVQQIRDLAAEGRIKEAEELATKYFKANTAGIAIGTGMASTGLLGDLAVTIPTSIADSAMEGDFSWKNMGTNTAINVGFDLLGHVLGKTIDKGIEAYKARKAFTTTEGGGNASPFITEELENAANNATRNTSNVGVSNLSSTPTVDPNVRTQTISTNPIPQNTVSANNSNIHHNNVPPPQNTVVTLYGGRQISRNDYEALLRRSNFNDLGIAEYMQNFDNVARQAGGARIDRNALGLDYSNKLDPSNVPFKYLRTPDKFGADDSAINIYGKTLTRKQYEEELTLLGYNARTIADKLRKFDIEFYKNNIQNSIFENMYFHPTYARPTKYDEATESYILNNPEEMYRNFFLDKRHQAKDINQAYRSDFKFKSPASNVETLAMYKVITDKHPELTPYVFNGKPIDDDFRRLIFDEFGLQSPFNVAHMSWFQGNNGAKYVFGAAPTYTKRVINPDGTISIVNQKSSSGTTAGKDALKFMQDIPRHAAVTETNTSLDSEALKLAAAARNYGTGPGQFTIEEMGNSISKGNNFHLERIYLEDILNSSNDLNQAEREALEQYIENRRLGIRMPLNLSDFPSFKEIAEKYYKKFTKEKMVNKLASRWEKIKELDDRYKDVVMPYVEDITDAQIQDILNNGEFSPLVYRTPVAAVKHKNGGKLNKYDEGGYKKLGVPWASLNTSDYDYFNASKDNMPKEKKEHWTSRNPNTGKILKSANHPTIDVALNMEGILGNKVYKNVDGTYSSYEENQFPTSLGTRINNYEYDVSPLDPNKRFKDIKTTKGRKYNEDNITYISDKLNNTLLNDTQKNAILGSIIEESGGNPFAVDDTGKFKGLLQWEDSRYSPDNSISERDEINNQLNYLIESLYNIEDRKSWTHGGKGSGYKSGKHARDSFLNTNDLYEAVHALNRGYIRPTGGDYSVKNRYNVAKQIK